jgi:glutamyl-tRNA reductase
MGRRAAENLAEDDACTVVVASRTREHATALASQVGGRTANYAQMQQALAEADLVITATSAPHVILDASTVERVMRARDGRPLCLIDVAVPRDIDPRAGDIEGVSLFNIDDLNQLVDSSRAERQQAVAQVQEIIAQEVNKFWEWHMERRAAPVISGLRGRADAIRQRELSKALRRLGHLNLSERDRDVIAAMSAGIVGKLLAAPTAHLKERVQSGDGQVYLDTLAELFELTDGHEHDDLTPAV